jgi:hypothetical protein
MSRANGLVITHILPRRALRAQREAKKALLSVLRTVQSRTPSAAQLYWAVALGVLCGERKRCRKACIELVGNHQQMAYRLQEQQCYFGTLLAECWHLEYNPAAAFLVVVSANRGLRIDVD